MSAIPGEPLKQKANELTLKDGRKLKLKLPGQPPRADAAAAAGGPRAAAAPEALSADSPQRSAVSDARSPALLPALLASIADGVYVVAAGRLDRVRQSRRIGDPGL